MDPLVGTANFTAAEWESHSSNGETPAEYRANAQATLEALQRVRDALGVPILITDAWRSAADNAATRGAAANSQHMTAEGVDFDVPTLTKRAVAVLLDAADDAGALGDYRQFIYYLTDGHYHLGTGSGKQKLVKVDDSANPYVPYTGVDSLPQSALDVLTAPQQKTAGVLVPVAIVAAVALFLVMRKS